MGPEEHGGLPGCARRDVLEFLGNVPEQLPFAAWVLGGLQGFIDREPEMNVLSCKRIAEKNFRTVTISAGPQNATQRGRHSRAATLTKYTALSAVLRTVWGAGGSIVCRGGGDRDRVTWEVWCGDATINRI